MFTMCRCDQMNSYASLHKELLSKCQFKRHNVWEFAYRVWYQQRRQFVQTLTCLWLLLLCIWNLVTASVSRRCIQCERAMRGLTCITRARIRHSSRVCSCDEICTLQLLDNVVPLATCLIGIIIPVCRGCFHSTQPWIRWISNARTTLVSIKRVCDSEVCLR